MSLKLLTPFENIGDSSQQVFRQLLKAMSEPGHIEKLDSDSSVKQLSEHDSVIYPTTWALVQTLLDADCRVALLPSMEKSVIKQSLQFFTDSNMESNYQYANFALLSIQELHNLDQFNSGTLESPHESCTLIVQTPEISNEPQMILEGPGIKKQRQLNIGGLEQEQIKALQGNHQNYPCGLDIIFCSPEKICALPRSTSITVAAQLKETA